MDESTVVLVKDLLIKNIIFEDGTSVSEFSLRLLDYGDDNTVFGDNPDTDENPDAEEQSDSSDNKPDSVSNHTISLIGYDADGNVVSTDILNYTLKNGQAYRNDELLGSGDACLDQPGELGNYPFEISGKGITQVKLKFHNDVTGNQPADPNFAINGVCFSLEKLPSKLPKYLSIPYIEEHLTNFIDELQREYKFSPGDIRQNLQKFIELRCNAIFSATMSMDYQAI